MPRDMPHRRRVKPQWFAAMMALVTGCSSTATYHMGDPLRAESKAQTPHTAPAGAQGTQDAPTEYRDKTAQRKADEWETKWQQIQSPSDSVSWSDHFQVCGLKYRFRNYDQLFRCLDLLDAKIAAGGERVPKAELVQRGAPVMSGWLRASA